MSEIDQSPLQEAFSNKLNVIRGVSAVSRVLSTTTSSQSSIIADEIAQLSTRLDVIEKSVDVLEQRVNQELDTAREVPQLCEDLRHHRDYVYAFYAALPRDLRPVHKTLSPMRPQTVKRAGKESMIEASPRKMDPSTTTLRKQKVARVTEQDFLRVPQSIRTDVETQTVNDALDIVASVSEANGECTENDLGKRGIRMDRVGRQAIAVLRYLKRIDDVHGSRSGKAWRLPKERIVIE